MTQIVEIIKAWFERQAFGICEWWGDKLSIRSSNIRLFFIYTSFLTVGSPIIVYMVMGFWKRIRLMVSDQKRGSIWDS